MGQVLEAVPNVSEGRDPARLRAFVAAVEGGGVEVLDASMDPDHNRAVITFIGEPDAVEDASVRLAEAVFERVDLRQHRGVHPRLGALDVLPFIPLHGLTMADAVASARRVAARIVERGVPVYLYGRASDPPGRVLADVRRGGFEGRIDPTPGAPAPDLLPDPWPHPGVHPVLGAVCVGARPVLLAWNVRVTGIELDEVRAIAACIRERGGRFAGLRALGLALPEAGILQVSMNLEDLGRTAPLDVFRAIEDEVLRRGGGVVDTEIIGMVPEALALPAAGDRMRIRDLDGTRILEARVEAFRRRRVASELRRLADRVRVEPREPSGVVEALESLAQSIDD